MTRIEIYYLADSIVADFLATAKGQSISSHDIDLSLMEYPDLYTSMPIY